MSKEDWSYGYEEKYTDSNGKTWSRMVYPNQQGNYGMGVATAWSVKKNVETPPPSEWGRSNGPPTGGGYGIDVDE